MSIIVDPNAEKDYPFSIYDLQTEILKTTDVTAVTLPQRGSTPNHGAVVKEGKVLLDTRTPASAIGFVTAVALYRVVKAKATELTNPEQRLAMAVDFVSVRQPYQHAAGSVRDALTKYRTLLLSIVEPADA